MRLTIRRKFFLSHFLAVLLVSGSIGSYFYLSAVGSLTRTIQSRLVNSAALIAQALDAGELGHIRSAQDLDDPAYLRNLALIRQMKHTNKDIAYAYVMRRTGETVHFVIDSDESEEQAGPGYEYTDLTPRMVEGFDRPSVDDGIYEDEWGAFMSGYAPLRNGNGEYLVGIDMRAEELKRKLSAVQIAGTISLALSILLAVLFSRMLSLHFTRPIQMLIARCRAIAEGDLEQSAEAHTGDELEQLVEAFNAMSHQLAESRAQTESARRSVEQARDNLEVRVVERTRELTDLNERLRHEVAERTRAEARLAEAARTDPLTGLMNRRAMLERLEESLRRFRQDGTLFTLLLADIDRFKSINDRFGHDVGDKALIRTAECITARLRPGDHAARWGGEEFLILLSQTDLNTGVDVAESVRRSVAVEPLDVPDAPQSLTLSLGVAAYRDGQTLDACIKAADTALYRAKVEGRDRVLAAPAG